LIVIGYSNFSGKTGNSKELFANTLAATSSNSIGDVQLVSSSAVVENDKTENENSENANQAVVENIKENGAVVSNEDSVKDDGKDLQEVSAQTSSSSNENYFAELKKDRDDMYSKSLETYQKIIDSQNVSSEQKSIAIQEIDKISKTKNSIQTAEELIKLKGFEDVVIYSSNEQISIIVRVAVLSDSQVAQIQNIVSKELGVEINNITISNK